MTEDLPHVVKTNFEQEHYHESKKSSVFAYTPGVPSLDELLVMDLDAYNYISAYLFEGMGTEEDFVEELDLDNNLAIFRKELLKNPQLFGTIRHPHLLQRPTLKRVNISIALLAIKELCDIRRDGESDSHEDEAENYMINKQIAACYRKLAEFICGESLSVQEKVEDIVVTMLVEFKSLYFLSELAAGLISEGEYVCFVTEQAKNLLKSVFTLTQAETLSFNNTALRKINSQLQSRMKQLDDAIETGEISIDHAISIATEQTLLKCLMSLAIAANTEMLPVLHPSHHSTGSALTLQKAKDYVKQIRQARQRQGNDYSAVQSRKRMSMGSSASGSPRKQVRKRKPWTKEETDALEKGMLDHGTDWARIHREYFEVLSQRNPVALKDRARSMRQIKERANEELGVWAEACKTTSK